MCGRFNITDDPMLHELLRSLGIDMRMETRYNIAPTENIPVIINADSGLKKIHTMRWWLTPHWAPEISTKYSMFNAKSETLETSKAFSGPFRHRRGIIPVSSFIEWKTENGAKQPYLIHNQDRPLLFAALWDTWEKDDYYLESTTIVTTAANSQFARLHHRMPVLLDEESVNDWLDSRTSTKDLRGFFDASRYQALEAYPISKAINNSRNKDDRAITPIGEKMNLS